MCGDLPNRRVSEVKARAIHHIAPHRLGFA